ncbi:hypothetical protein SAMN02745221_01007 [Thermosyntropha lipolytica DSM 11003]|uniref:Phosphoesterase n=1 Tax=Thermosyntropha lipolytica DSM 11003 TaxID=1123382 RepID=A0A1M5MT17_9FIRM|nr:metallophosphoesterase [Thermosyntropha lipolytica]SHG80458.1 hypothetical protein SAMN02745221_01007 [Thermosyntropha lipolytica DSM 11003]
MEKDLKYKKIAVLGDTHHNTERLVSALKGQGVEYFLFTGDYYDDAVRLSRELKVGFTGVLGNCDLLSGQTGASLEECINIYGKKVYLLHGHQYRVKEGLNLLYYRALEVEADVVIFGHTHIPFCDRIDDVFFLNPGSPSKPRKGNKGTYMVIDGERERFNVRLFEL